MMHMIAPKIATWTMLIVLNLLPDCTPPLFGRLLSVCFLVSVL